MDLRWLVVAAVAGACVAVPPFQGEQAPALLTVNTQTGEVASTPSAPILYVVKFAERGVRMPAALLVEGTDALHDGECGFEGGIGINLYPAFTASAPTLGGDDKTGVTDAFAVDWAGPVIARVTVTWHTTYTCSGGVQRAAGTSTFTMFPNGRIVRFDRAKPSTTALTVDGSSCGCSTDDNFNFSSSWAFQPTSQTVVPDGTAWSDGEAKLGCAVYPGHMIGVSFSDPGHVRLFPGAGAAAFDYDWARAVTTLDPDERETTSAILLSKETQVSRCGEVTADLADPPITIGGAAGITSDASGIYPGPARQTAPYEITSPAALPRGFTVSLDLGALPVVERTPPATGAWYAAQVEGDRILLWFRDGLDKGQTITIRPR